ncbi:putative glutamate-1-semialdehyde 2,1-aminomutase [Aaosphaeria arxii CBS 175.79]|uniref:Putative glutamate-1-semialdehyde 2,1-aminomutase n=1 Tax=Aaosphaeria arxii CBS 175.79 TaxID=1450172 RepID=A0A6A5XJB2_9PLEO|nr:putative glutamate-1-semialdehyde 2,1-aminomutase [Aaosphaeria arxii CBS 175.79]KAF2012917.1 putative glutamate-1-semialdehyde 2,1-aminomutase [Aaosphaeria arxii CBS 175.79]
MAPKIQVVQGAAQVPCRIEEGPGAYTDIVGSAETAEKPIVAGVWTLADIEEETPAWETEWDEVKYIVEGEAVFKDESTGEEFLAKTGDFVWFPTGAKTALVRSSNLKTLYTEQRHANWAEDRNEAIAETDTRLKELIQSFIESNPGSAKAAKDAASVLPGGNTRTVLHQTPFPLVLRSGSGVSVTSMDGDTYIDFVSEYSACMFGHSHPRIHEAVHEALSIGMNLGSVIGKEAEFGSLIQKRFPSMELMRFANSGTEANTLALTGALAFTGRKEVLVFKHGYHGSTISFPLGADSPTNLPYQFVVGTFNDIEATRPLLRAEIGAILVEPLQSSGGMVLGNPEFLQFLRDAADVLGAVLIFDEVVTSRLDYHGLQGYFGIKPDMTTLGKYIGGGFSFGCFGGKREIMQQFDPTTKDFLAHSGTFNNNVFTMVAGIAGLKLTTADEIHRINNLGNKLRKKINEMVLEKGTLEIKAIGFGSAIGFHFVSERGEIVRDIFYFELLKRGILIGRRGFAMLNLTHTEAHIDRLVEAFSDIVSTFT